MIMMHLPKAVHTCNVMIYRYLQYHLLNLLLVFVQLHAVHSASTRAVVKTWSGGHVLHLAGTIPG